MNNITERKTLGKGKYLELKELSFTDQSGEARKWESAERVNSCGAVMIFAEIKPGNDILLVRQFRAPAGRFVWELPAGLIDPGENAERCAVRELYEETGYTGRIEEVFPPSFNSPGMSGEAITLVKMTIDGTAAENLDVQNHPESSECGLTCTRVKRTQLQNFIRAAAASGDGIDSKLLIYAFLA